MFTSDDQITTVDFVNLKNYDEDLEELEVDEMVLCAYMDDIRLSDYLKSTVERDYAECLI